MKTIERRTSLYGYEFPVDQTLSSHTPKEHAEAVKASVYSDRDNVRVTVHHEGGTAESAYLRGEGWWVNWSYK